MFATAYQTAACQFHDRNAIQKALDHARIEDNFFPAITPYQKQRVRHVYRLAVDDDLTPAFTQPYLYTGLDDDPEAYIIDARLFFRVHQGHTLTLTNADEYVQQIKRAILTHYWNAHPPSDLLRLGDLPTIVFSRWISETLSKRFGLSPLDQSKATIITYTYWYHLHTPADELAPSEKRTIKMASRLSQLTSIPTSLGIDIIEQLPPMSDIQTYTETLIDKVGSMRLNKLTPAFLFSMLGGSWFGLNNKETVGVALEHPPTFLSLIDASLNSRNYRQSVIGRLVYENDKRERGSVFSKTLQSLLHTYFGEH